MNEAVKDQPFPLWDKLPDEPDEQPIDINKVIRNLPTDTYAVGTAQCEAWDEIREKFWEKGLLSLGGKLKVDRGDHHIPDNVFGGPPPTSCFAIPIPGFLHGCLGLKSGAIMGRFDYIGAEDAALSASTSIDLFVVTGTPGIGITHFLSVNRR